MKKHDCKAIRQEIDEANLDARLTLEASEHLGQCDECRRFHNDRRRLRSLMAELEMVGAPADFDFRLRARLAREKPSNGSGLLLAARPIAALALLILIAVVAVVVKRGMSPVSYPPPVSKATPKESGPTVNEVKSATPTGSVASSKDDAGQNVATGNDSQRVPVSPHNAGAPRKIAAQKTPSNTAANPPRLGIRESAGTAATMITPDSPGTLVLVPIYPRSFKFSVDNGRGGARTISLPPVSFGSQRLLAREASFVPVSSAKGDW
jgi:hypothetical protein